MNSLVKIALIGIASFASQTHALDCPQKVKVEVRGLQTVAAADDAEVAKIFEAGDRQSSVSYIKAVLGSLNAITDLDDVLAFDKKRSNFEICAYKGNASSLKLHAKSYSQRATAVLSIGYIEYVNPTNGENPASAKGFQAELTTPLKLMTVAKVESYKTKPSVLTLPLEVQIPLGDYGTDGFVEEAPIGSAASVNYEVIR